MTAAERAILEAREAGLETELARIRDALEEFRALVASSTHPVVSALRRLDGPAWKAAGLDLLELLVSVGAASRRGSSR